MRYWKAAFFSPRRPVLVMCWLVVKSWLSPTVPPCHPCHSSELLNRPRLCASHADTQIRADIIIPLSCSKNPSGAVGNCCWDGETRLIYHPSPRRPLRSTTYDWVFDACSISSAEGFGIWDVRCCRNWEWPTARSVLSQYGWMTWMLVKGW